MASTGSGEEMHSLSLSGTGWPGDQGQDQVCAMLAHGSAWLPTCPTPRGRNTQSHGVPGTGDNSQARSQGGHGVPGHSWGRWGRGPCPPQATLKLETLAQVSRDLYLLYRIHLRRRTQEFHFLSRVYEAGKSMAYVHPYTARAGGSIRLSG